MKRKANFCVDIFHQITITNARTYIRHQHTITYTHTHTHSRWVVFKCFDLISFWNLFFFSLCHFHSLFRFLFLLLLLRVLFCGQTLYLVFQKPFIKWDGFWWIELSKWHSRKWGSEWHKSTTIATKTGTNIHTHNHTHRQFWECHSNTKDINIQTFKCSFIYK